MTHSNWRTPLVVLICGGLILTLALGTRHTFGLYLQPMTADLGWSRQTFAIALAIQNLLYGLATPFTGMIADKLRRGARAGGRHACSTRSASCCMAFSETGWEFSLSAGLLVGARAVVQRLQHRLRRGRARVSAGEAHAGARHRRLRGLVRAVHDAALRPDRSSTRSAGTTRCSMLAVTVMLIAAAFAPRWSRTRRRRPPRSTSSPFPKRCAKRSGTAASCCCARATSCAASSSCSSRCTFPAYLIDQRMTPETGMAALALIGLFNIFGSYFWGWLGNRYTKKYVLSALYFIRAAADQRSSSILPVSPLSVYLFGAVIGFLWLGTVPVTSGLIAHIFGVKIPLHAHRHRVPLPPGRQLPRRLDRRPTSSTRPARTA